MNEQDEYYLLSSESIIRNRNIIFILIFVGIILDIIIAVIVNTRLIDFIAIGGIGCGFVALFNVNRLLFGVR